MSLPVWPANETANIAYTTFPAFCSICGVLTWLDFISMLKKSFSAQMSVTSTVFQQQKELRVHYGTFSPGKDCNGFWWEVLRLSKRLRVLLLVSFLSFNMSQRLSLMWWPIFEKPDSFWVVLTPNFPDIYLRWSPFYWYGNQICRLLFSG